MPADALTVRDARPEDAERLAGIYSHYVLNTAVSFEYHAPTACEFRERIRRITKKYPYLVCLQGDTIVGYAYADAYSPREAYAWTVATSIYVDRERRRQGAGSLLYRELERRLKDMGIVNLLAGVACAEEGDEYVPPDSYRFHLKEGYSEVARMKSVGFKFSRWYDLVWLQKKIRQAE